MTCKKCSREHEPVTVVEWLWQLRDYKPKPPVAQLGVLMMAVTRLDPKTGCGWVSNEQAALDAAVSTDTAERALKWARDNFLIRRVTRGHRVTAERATASEWQLIRQVQTRTTAGLGDKPTPQHSGVGPVANPANGGSQPRKRPEPTPLPSGSKKDHLQARPNTSSPARGSLFEQMHAVVPTLEREDFNALRAWLHADKGWRSPEVPIRDALAAGDEAVLDLIREHQESADAAKPNFTNGAGACSEPGCLIPLGFTDDGRHEWHDYRYNPEEDQ